MLFRKNYNCLHILTAQPRVNSGIAKRLVRGALWEQKSPHKRQREEEEEEAESQETLPNIKRHSTQK